MAQHISQTIFCAQAQPISQQNADYSLEIKQYLEKIISQRVLPSLAFGLIEYRKRVLNICGEDQASLEEIFQASLSLLYNYLFLFHAEARGFLPTQSLVSHKKSLLGLIYSIQEGAWRKSQVTDESYSYWSYTCRLSGLSKLFKENENFLKKHKIANTYLASALLDLAIYPGEGAESDSFTIDYSQIDLRHLGEIYESLLDARIVLGDRANKNAQSVSLLRDGEKRKGSGIFYTPQYLVQDIVQGTLGAKLDQLEKESSDPALDAISLRVLDPAMGTGHFLAYVLEFISNRVETLLKKFPQSGVLKEVEKFRAEFSLEEAEPRLKLIKALVLKNCIYGVDLDPAAVQIARSRLWLECFLTGLSPLFFIHNLKQGNSLIGVQAFNHETNFEKTTLDASIAKYFISSKSADDVEACAKERSFFHWRLEFPGIFSAESPGFDVVLGNPPYRNAIEKETALPEDERCYFKSVWQSARGAYDLSILFQELGISLLKAGGKISFVVPNKYLCTNYGKTLRSLLLREVHVDVLRDYSEVKPFEDASVYPVVYVYTRDDAKLEPTLIEKLEKAKDSQIQVKHRTSISRDFLASLPELQWGVLVCDKPELALSLLQQGVPLEQEYELSASATAEEAYRFRDYLLEADSLDCSGFRLLTSGQIDPFENNWSERSAKYLKRTWNRPFLPLDCPALSEERKRQYLEKKIIVAGMTKELEAVLVNGDYAGSIPSTHIFKKSDSQYSLEFLVGLLNSSLMAWIYRALFQGLSLAGNYLSVGKSQLRCLPLPKIDFEDKVDNSAAFHQTISKLAVKLSQSKLRQQQLENAFWKGLKNQVDDSVYVKLTKSKRKQILIKRKACSLFVREQASSTLTLVNSLLWTEEAFIDFARVLAGELAQESKLKDVYHQQEKAYRAEIEQQEYLFKQLDDAVYKIYGFPSHQ